MERFATDPAALIGLMAGLSLTLVWATAEMARALREPHRATALGTYGAAAFFGAWFLLLPLDILGGVPGDPSAADGLALTAGLQWLGCALFCGIAAWNGRGLRRWVFAGAGLLILGELSGWGQWLVGIRAPDYLLVEPFSLGSLVAPVIADSVLAAAGWSLIAGALILRYLRRPARWPVVDGVSAWINRSTFGLPLALTAGTVLQHPAFHATAAIAVSAAALHGAIFICLRTGPAASRTRGPFRPFVRQSATPVR